MSDAIDVSLELLELPDGAAREACAVLAGIGIGIAGGDLEAAREPVREVLQAIGAVPYEAVFRRAHVYGEAVP